MITTLDRMFLISYFRSYAIVWTSLIGLYVVLDLFTHLDDFANRSGIRAMAEHIIGYYGYRIPQLFDLMAEPITLMAAAFSVSWMQRNNELLPQLSAGIPTRRAIRPILMGAAITLSLGPINQEFLIPIVADKLMTQRDDPEGAKAQVLMGAFDSPTGTHLEGYAGFRKDRKVDRLNVTFPENSPSGMVHIAAAEGVYIPKGDGPLTGGWMLTGIENPEKFEGRPLPTNVTAIGPGRFFLKVTDADFDAVCRGGTWYIYAPDHQASRDADRPRTAPTRQNGSALPHAADASACRSYRSAAGLVGDSDEPKPARHHQRRDVPGLFSRAEPVRDCVQVSGRPGCVAAAFGRVATGVAVRPAYARGV